MTDTLAPRLAMRVERAIGNMRNASRCAAEAYQLIEGNPAGVAQVRKAGGLAAQSLHLIQCSIADLEQMIKQLRETYIDTEARIHAIRKAGDA